MKTLLFSLLGLCISILVSAQDKIHKKNGEVVDVKVTEIGTDEVKYKMFSDIDGPVYSLEKDRIFKIVYANGRTETYQDNLKDPELYQDQSRNAVKVNFLSPLLGYTQLNYEHNLKPGRSYEVSLGLIGLGKRQEAGSYYDQNAQTSESLYRSARGLFMGAGYKFSRTPDFLNKGMKYSHLLQGAYAKPELILGSYGQNFYRSNQNGNPIKERESISFGGFLINIGKQWVLGETILIDLYGGVGYVIDNLAQHENNGEFNYYEIVGSHFALISGVDSELGFTGGFKLGLLLNQKKR